MARRLRSEAYSPLTRKNDWSAQCGTSKAACRWIESLRLLAINGLDILKRGQAIMTEARDRQNQGGVPTEILLSSKSAAVNTLARDRGSIDVSQKALLVLQSYRVPSQFRRIGKILIGASRIFAFVQCQGQKRTTTPQAAADQGPKGMSQHSRGSAKAEEEVIIPQGLLRIEVH